MIGSNRDRIGRALELLRDGLAPFVERELQARLGPSWQRDIDARRARPLRRRAGGDIHWDNQALLKTMIDNWQSVFRFGLGSVERSYVGELVDIRNRWAHEDSLDADDTFRALDTARRLLKAIGAAAQSKAIELVMAASVPAAKTETRAKPPALAITRANRGHEPSGRNKYAALRDHLLMLRDNEWRASFDEIEAILAFPLPRSARQHQAWWSNTTSHSYAQAWLSAGWRTARVDLAGGMVSFHRSR